MLGLQVQDASSSLRGSSQGVSYLPRGPSKPWSKKQKIEVSLPPVMYSLEPSQPTLSVYFSFLEH